MKTCSSCAVEKPVGEFYAASARCKECCRAASRARYYANREAILKQGAEYRKRNRQAVLERRRRYAAEHVEENRRRARQWQLDNPERYKERMRGYHAGQKFGLSLDEYAALLAKGCSICGATPDEAQICIDHDHASGKVRDALCITCNLMLGGAKDRPEVLEAGAEYLRLHREIEQRASGVP